MTGGLIVELTGIGKTVPSGRGETLSILHDVNLTIEPGEFVALTGPSGSGKTTLLNIIGLLDTPTIGSYRLESIDVAGASDRARTRLRARHIGFIFQAFHLSESKTAAQNVELGLTCQGVPRRQRRERAVAALGAVGMGHRVGSLPRTLSGGEQQRTAVARALARHPRLILADEPTGNLDVDNADIVMHLLRDARDADSAVLMVTHDHRVTGWADRTVDLAAGQTVPAPALGPSL